MLEVWGWACAVVGAFLSVPQVIRLLRQRTSAGLSLRSWQLNVAIGLGWTLHGVLADYPNMWVSNGAMAILAATVLVMIRHDRQLGVRATWAFPAAAFGVLVGMEMLTTPLMFALVILIPQLSAQLYQTVELVRAPDVRGLSTTFFALGALLPTMWFLWGVGAADMAVLVTAGATAVVCWVNLAWLLARTIAATRPSTVARDDDQDVAPHDDLDADRDAAEAPEPAYQS